MFGIKFWKNKSKNLPPCPSGVYWIIGPGDTFYLISKKLNVPLSSLIAANPKVDPKNLKIGSKVCIPSK